MKVLLTDIKNRKSFDVFNCLRRLNYDVVLAAEKPTLWDRCIYGQEVHELRNASIKEFSSRLKQIRSYYRDEALVYIPVEEDTTLLFLEFIEKSGFDGFYCALPDKASFELARNKKQLNRFCKAEGLPCPEELAISSLQLKFSKSVAKPCVGSGGNGLIYIDKPEDLKKLASLSEDYLIQEQLPNPKEVEGGFFLFNRGQMVSYYGHRRLRTYPVKAGVTVYSKIAFNDSIRDTGARLLQRLNWHGLAMVEFLLDPTSNEYKVIEVNPRLWGSFLLGEFADTGFLETYINISLGQKVKQYVPRADVAIRWVFPFDVLNYIESRGRIRGFWNFDRSHTCYISFTFSTKRRSLLYLILNTFSLVQLKTLLHKISRNR